MVDRGNISATMNGHKNSSKLGESKISAANDFCAQCVNLLPDRILGQRRSRRQKRYIIGRSVPQKSGSPCRMCRFLQQLEALEHDASGATATNASLVTGSSQAAFSTFDTHRPWWYLLGLETQRPLSEYMWYERITASNATKLAKPRIVVNWLPDNINGESGALASVPRKRSVEEAEHGMLDLNVAKEWLQVCEEDHATSCEFTKRGRIPIDIRLIDLHAREIVSADTESQYVALSYVWGNKMKTRHGKMPDLQSISGVSGLSEVSHTRKLPEKLPATLEDAMTVATKLGEQYLWIDLFCIDQTNEHELESQIHQMNMIYQSAKFTIIARDGEDAYAGIAGISRPMKLRAQPTCQLSDGELMATALRPAIANAGKAPWDTRAWTMQEYLFSYRVLSFTNHNLRMICRKEYFVDTIVTETSSDRRPVRFINKDDWDDVVALDLRIRSWDFKTFNSLVSLYTARLLSYPDDILNACQGALTELQMRTAVTFKGGIPVQDIHRALLWSSHRQHTLTRRPGFPSWSWSGWFGRIEYRQWILDLEDVQEWQDNGDRTIVNKKSKKRKGGKANRTARLGSENVAEISFLRKGALRVCSQAASCTLQKRRDDRKSATLLTVLDDEVGTLVKKDLGFHWTILNTAGRPMIDIANNAEEPDVFDETNHFLRLSKEESDALEEVEGQVQLVLIHQLPLVRDSLEHNWYLADMMSCLVVVRNNDDEGTVWRLGALLLEKEVFEGFKPKDVEVDVV